MASVSASSKGRYECHIKWLCRLNNFSSFSCSSVFRCNSLAASSNRSKL